MKVIYLIRHAKSSWKDLSIQDFERPLNDRGKNDAPIIGKHLNQLGFNPDLIVCSPAKRTISTAKLICKNSSYEFKNVQTISSIYESTLQTLIELINNLSNNYKEITLIGHNPGITNLYNYLCDDDLVNIPTCGVVKIELEISQWNEIIKGIGIKKFFIYPKML